MKFLENFLTDLGNMLASMMKFGAECAVDAIADAGKKTTNDYHPFTPVFEDHESPTGYSEDFCGHKLPAKRPD